MVSWQGGMQDRLITFWEKKSQQICNTETNRQERKQLKMLAVKAATSPSKQKAAFLIDCLGTVQTFSTDSLLSLSVSNVKVY